MQAAGLTMVPSIGFNYVSRFVASSNLWVANGGQLIESYPQVSGDCFVMTTIVRGVVAFAWTFFIGEWVQSAGAALPFGIFGMRKNELLPEKRHMPGDY
jgi:hypothetical protein